MKNEQSGFVPNPLLASLMGLCPLLGAADSFAEAFIFGLATMLGVMLAGALATATKNILIAELRAYATTALISIYAFLVELAVEAYSPTIANGLGFFMPLLAVNCLLLHFQQAVGRGNRRTKDLLGPLALYWATGSLLCLVRELVGYGTISLPRAGYGVLVVAVAPAPPMIFFSSTAGAFILLAFFVASYRLILKATGRRIP